MLVNLAKVSANGQITVPMEIRRRLKLKEGDKVLFIERENGEIVIDNASAMAVVKAQRAFADVAKTAGIGSEDEVQAFVDEVRYPNGKKP
jgi:AbrB family looped-hinge helix DNA binding protein